MIITPKEVKTYVAEFLASQFKEKFKIDIINDSYVVYHNGYQLYFKIYEFWNKSDKKLLRDFYNFSFKDDYIGTIFFFLTGYWEYIHKDKKDKFKRFPYKESFQYKRNVIEEPVVDILTHKIKEKLNLSYRSQKAKIFITHDIDHLYCLKGLNFYKMIIKYILKERNISYITDIIKKKYQKKDPYDIKHIINLHKKYKTKGTYFFISSIQPKSVGGGYDLNLNDLYLQRIFQEIISTDGNIGIHYDIRYLNQENRVFKDKKTLENFFNKNIVGGRAHYLIFDISKSFDFLEKAGISLDSTGYYAENIGFRFGTSKAFKPYNFKEKRLYNLLEVPLIVMDATLNYSTYMGLSPKKAFEKVKNIIDKINNYKGILTFLWHNSSFYTKEWKDWEWLYEEIIKYSLSKKFRSINIEEVLNES